MVSQYASIQGGRGGIQLGSQHALDIFDAESRPSETEEASETPDKACGMISQGLAKRVSPAIKAGGDALAGLQGGPGIGVSGNGHSEPSRDDRRDGANEEGDGGEGPVV